MNTDPVNPLTPDSNPAPASIDSESEAVPVATPAERALVEVDPSSKALVETEMSTDDPLQRETEALVDAIKKRAQVEAQGAGELTRDAYLTAVRQAREAIEQNKLFDAEQIEYSMKLIQKEAEKNWQTVLDEMSGFGDRLSDAAKAAWDALTAPKPNSK